MSWESRIGRISRISRVCRAISVDDDWWVVYAFIIIRERRERNKGGERHDHWSERRGRTVHRRRNSRGRTGRSRTMVWWRMDM